MHSGLLTGNSVRRIRLADSPPERYPNDEYDLRRLARCNDEEGQFSRPLPPVARVLVLFSGDTGGLSRPNPDGDRHRNAE